MAWKRSALDRFMREPDNSDFMIWLKSENRPLKESDFQMYNIDIFGVFRVCLYGSNRDEIMVLQDDDSSVMWELLCRFVIDRLTHGLEVPMMEVVKWCGCEGDRILLGRDELIKRAKLWFKKKSNSKNNAKRFMIE